MTGSTVQELHKAFQRVAPVVRPGLTYDDWETLPEPERDLASAAVREALGSRDFLAAVLEEADLEQVTKALARETVIRHMVAESGETREIVAEQVDALSSMDQEAVLDLTEGQPTTLRDALERWRETIEGEGYVLSLDRLLDELGAILAYPFPEGDG